MDERGVGPVLLRGAGTDVLLAAIRRRNPRATFVDRSSYVRVLAHGRCLLLRQDVEEEGWAPFRLPGDLEALMPSFSGRFRVSSEQAEWLEST